MVLEQNRAQGFPWQVSILNSMLPLWGQGVCVCVRGLEGVPGLPGAPQDEAGLTQNMTG